jgi:hypothetical protein
MSEYDYNTIAKKMVAYFERASDSTATDKMALLAAQRWQVLISQGATSAAEAEQFMHDLASQPHDPSTAWIELRYWAERWAAERFGIARDSPG